LGLCLFLLLSLIFLVLFSDLAYVVGFVQRPTEEHRRPLQELIRGVLEPKALYTIRLSLVTASLTTALAVLLGAPAAYLLSRYRLPASGLLDTLLDLPIVLPPAVMGISLLVFFQTDLGAWTLGLLDRTPLRFLSAWSLGDYLIERNLEFVHQPRGIVLAQFVVAASFCVRALKAAFDAIDPRLEGVARTLGCSHFRAFLKVTLPTARTGLIAGAVMTWARAVGEFGPILFFVGTAERVRVMPVAIYLEMSTGNIAMALTIALLMIAMGTVTLWLFKRLGGRGYLW